MTTRSPIEDRSSDEHANNLVAAGALLSAWIYHERGTSGLNLRIETVGVRATTTSQFLGLDEAEQFLLECLALVRRHHEDGA